MGVIIQHHLQGPVPQPFGAVVGPTVLTRQGLRAVRFLVAPHRLMLMLLLLLTAAFIACGAGYCEHVNVSGRLRLPTLLLLLLVLLDVGVEQVWRLDGVARCHGGEHGVQFVQVFLTVRGNMEWKVLNKGKIIIFKVRSKLSFYDKSNITPLQPYIKMYQSSWTYSKLYMNLYDSFSRPCFPS